MSIGLAEDLETWIEDRSRIRFAQQFDSNDGKKNGERIDVELEDVLPRPNAVVTSYNPAIETLPSMKVESGFLQEHQLKSRPLIRRFSPAAVPWQKVEVFQQFEGVITSIEGNWVWAELHDLTNPNNPHEVVELPAEEFSDSDRRLLEEGSVFYWIIGGIDDMSKGKFRISEVRLRRTGQWSKRKFSKIQAEGDSLFHAWQNDSD